MNLPEPYASAPTPVTDNHSRVYQTAGMPLAYSVLLDLSRNLERQLAYAEAQLAEAKKRDVKTDSKTTMNLCQQK